MSTIHKSYGLSFDNKIIRAGQVWKGCSGTNPSNFELEYFIHQIQFVENILEVYLPILIAVLNNGANNNVITSGTSYAEIEPTTTQLFGSNGNVSSISTTDFKAVLEEYASFLQTPPLNGNKAR